VSTMDRRQAITAFAAMSAALGIPAGVLEAATRKVADSRQPTALDFVPRFFTAAELATATLLGDLIIPKDERSGSASDAKVPEYMDFLCAEYRSTGEWMRPGLAWLEGESTRRFQKGFTAITAEQQGAILNDIAWPARAPQGMQDGVRFFNRFRDLTASGFWSSQTGVKDLGYMGNTFVREWTGCPPEAKAHLGVN
jgi:gluconate 2-dehydrogenase gamma chain